jgi:putative effector of murein hydrolase LrgA (UPF0299 family)
MQQSMVWTVGPWCQPPCSIICSTWLLATCFYFSEPVLSTSPFDYMFQYMLIMFIDATVRWVLDVSLSEQQTCAIYMLIMFATISGSLMWASLNNKLVLYIYNVDNVHERCCWVNKKHVLCWFIFFTGIVGYLAVIFKPTHEIWIS